MTADPTAIDISVDPTQQRFIGYTTSMHGSLPINVPFMTEIAGNLWQGGCRNGLVLPANIVSVVSLYPWEHYTVNHDLQSFLTIKMFDSLDQSTEQVLDIAAWVNACRRQGPVLVHCQGGLNRSSLVVGAALIMAGEMTGPEVIAHLREVRSPASLCNRTFEKWVRELEFESHPEWDACRAALYLRQARSRDCTGTRSPSPAPAPVSQSSA